MNESFPFSGPSGSDRLLHAIREIIAAEYPQATYAGLYEYRVLSATSAGAIDAVPVDSSIPLPPITGMPVTPGILGEFSQAAEGNFVLVQFVNMDPTRPEVISISQVPFQTTLDASGTVNLGPSTTALNLGSATSQVARGNVDTCSVYFAPGSSLVVTGLAGGLPVTGVVLIAAPDGITPAPCIGLINPCSTTVFA